MALIEAVVGKEELMSHVWQAELSTRTGSRAQIAALQWKVG
jgi:DNA-binding winged helix-turn-helix (wHTH) protein